MVQSDLARKIEKAKDYVHMVDVVLKDLKLPDPTKRKGLKQYATNFAQYSRKINACYDAHSQPEHKDYLVLAAIVNLWAKLAVDSVLRDRLLANGILERMAPLLSEGPEGTRQSVLLALSNLTHHAGADARKTIATLTVPAIINLLDTPDCKPRIAELGIAVLSHSMSSAVTEGEHNHLIGHEIQIPAALKDIDGVRMLSAVVEAMRRPDIDEELVSHGLDLLRTLAFSYSKEMRETSSDRPLVAALASPNIYVRLVGFMGILRLGSSRTEPESRMLNPMAVAQIANNMEKYFNPKLMDVLHNQYGGIEGGMIAEIAESNARLDKAIASLGRNWDYAQLGRTLCKRVLECEYSLGQGFIAGPGGIMEQFDVTFSRAAEALRQSTDPADAHLPYVLLIKIAMGSGDRAKVCSLSAQAVNKFPDVSFFYYTWATWTEESRSGLRLAKKGLACSDLTDYVKRGLLFKSAEAAFEMTMNGPLENAAVGSPAWREGVAILHCAQEDSRAYIEMTPMDQKNMKTMLYTYLAISIILEGDEIFKNLDMIRPYVEKVSLAEQIYAIAVRPLPRTQRKLAIDHIIPNFGKPLKNWRTVISRLDKPRMGHHHHQHLGPDDPDHILANWLARTALDDENAPETEFAELNAPDLPAPGTRAHDVLVYRCSLCGNPSASLKRCARCKDARYCDDACQRKHWKKGHKLVCKPPAPSPAK